MIKHDLGGSLLSDTALFGPSRFFFTAAAVSANQSTEPPGAINSPNSTYKPYISYIQLHSH